MSTICLCNVGLSNTGTPTCQPIASVARKLIVVPYYDSNGDVNSIEVGVDTLNDAFFTAKINAALAANRWFPLPLMKNVADERADSTFEEFGDGSKFFIKDGVRTLSALFPNQSPELLSKISSMRCTEIGVFVIDANNAIIGSQTVDGFLYPIKVEQQTWSPVLVKTTDAGVQKIKLTFDFAVEEEDENIRMITSGEANMLALKGLLDGYMTPSVITTTSFKATINTSFGDLQDPIKVQGLLAANFALYNITDSLSVTIITSTESPAGVYTITYVAQTSGDVLRLTPTKTGYDFSTVPSVAINIP